MVDDTFLHGYPCDMYRCERCVKRGRPCDENPIYARTLAKSRLAQ
jgi:hypothetical protein